MPSEVMTKSQVREFQAELNAFIKTYGDLGVAPLMVDGDLGPATRKRIHIVAYWLGFTKDHRKLSKEFRWMLRHPHALRGEASDIRVARAKRGSNRRKDRRHAVAASHRKARRTTGVGTFDGKPVANWLIPYLEWARAHGWTGQLNSGWRDPNYSEHLCFQMCGAPSCPGRCAGKSSNHVGSTKPNGAVDVSDYVRFGQLMRKCPLRPVLINVLGAQDPVHFSVSGR